MTWTILWRTSTDAGTDRWNIAIAQTEAGALDRAKHFILLGFPVHAIRTPSGDLFMDETAIAARFGGAHSAAVAT